jgi:hypothetical protein
MQHSCRPLAVFRPCGCDCRPDCGPADEGFGVGHTRETETKGIWVWGQPKAIKDEAGERMVSPAAAAAAAGCCPAVQGQIHVQQLCRWPHVQSLQLHTACASSSNGHTSNSAPSDCLSGC